MSCHVEIDNQTDHKGIIDVKRRRNLCSVDGRVKRNSLCAKDLQSCVKSKTRNQDTTCQTFRNKKQHWPTSSVRKLPTNHSDIKINRIFSTFQHHLAQDLKEIPTHVSLSNTEINDDTKSESSIEYDYTNPTTHIQQRHVSIATIHLQDQQWHQLELFIKHFSSCASLSNNLNINSSTTHLLIDDSSTPLQCTFSKKIFQAVARHIFIVSIRWIEECLLRNEIIDETSFEIHGDETISTMHLARQTSPMSLFPSSIAFIIDCNSFQRVLTRHELAELVILSGATLFDSEQKNSMESLLVLVEPSADRIQLDEKYQQWHRNVKFLTPGFLLKSIVYQKQQPFEDFEL